MKTLTSAIILILAVTAAPALSAQEPDGAALYLTHCKTCHGISGKPSARMSTLYPNIPLLTASFFKTRSADSVVAVLRNGTGKGMKSFKAKLTPDEMRAVAKHVRTLDAKP